MDKSPPITSWQYDHCGGYCQQACKSDLGVTRARSGISTSRLEYVPNDLPHETTKMRCSVRPSLLESVFRTGVLHRHCVEAGGCGLHHGQMRTKAHQLKVGYMPAFLSSNRFSSIALVVGAIVAKGILRYRALRFTQVPGQHSCSGRSTWFGLATQESVPQRQSFWATLQQLARFRLDIQRHCATHHRTARLLAT